MAFVDRSPDDHLVTALPGLSGFPTKHWAGMLTSDPTNQGRLFYWLIEAAKQPEAAPLVIWLNGGPVRVRIRSTQRIQRERILAREKRDRFSIISNAQAMKSCTWDASYFCDWARA